MPAPIKWTVELTAALMELRLAGASYETCAATLGIDCKVVMTKCQKLGLNGRYNRGNLSGPRAVARAASFHMEHDHAVPSATP